MADTSPSPSKEDTLLPFLPSNLLPLQLPGSSELSSPATTSSNGAAPQTFHQFPDLPAELRIEIWKFSLPHRVHTFPSPVKKFDFLEKHWTQEQVHGAKAAKPSVIAHVCSEARAVVLSSGSVKKIMIHGKTKRRDKLSHLWVDPKRDTVLINLGHFLAPRYRAGTFYNCRNKHHLGSLLRDRDMRIALDSSWALTWIDKDPGRGLYYNLVQGHKDCDFVIVDLQLDVTDEEAASTGLFDEFGADRSVLIPIEDTRQMSRLYDVQSNFSTTDLRKRWDNFTRFRYPANLVEFIQRWENLAAREMQYVRQGLDCVTGVEVETSGKDEDELREQAARAAEIRQSHPKLRPVIMVSRGADGLL